MNKIMSSKIRGGKLGNRSDLMHKMFVRVRKLVVPVLVVAMIAVGCGKVKTDEEFLRLVDGGGYVTIEVVEPQVNVSMDRKQELGEQIQLDAKKTYNNGFRQTIDTILNINIVTENGIDGKSGCIYVNEDGIRDGNTSLKDAFRNKQFITKYWTENKNYIELGKAGAEVYTDVSGERDGATAALNAYWELLPDWANPTEFNGSVTMTRDEFYSFLYRSINSVSELTPDYSYENAIGGETENSIYSQYMQKYNWINIENKGLDENTIGGKITKLEAIYMLMQICFPEEIDKYYASRQNEFSDLKDGGDLALKIGMKEEVVTESKDANGKKVKNTEVVVHDRWEAYTLAYAVKHPDEGIQTEVYDVISAAKQIGLIGSSTGWDSPVSRSEAIRILINAFQLQNELYGYLTEVEYGEIDPNNFIANGTIAGSDSEEGSVSWANGGEGTISIEDSDEWEMILATEIEDGIRDYYGNVIDEFGNSIDKDGKIVLTEEQRDKQYAIDGHLGEEEKFKALNPEVEVKYTDDGEAYYENENKDKVGLDGEIIEKYEEKSKATATPKSETTKKAEATPKAESTKKVESTPKPEATAKPSSGGGGLGDFGIPKGEGGGNGPGTYDPSNPKIKPAGG